MEIISGVTFGTHLTRIIVPVLWVALFRIQQQTGAMGPGLAMKKDHCQDP